MLSSKENNNSSENISLAREIWKALKILLEFFSLLEGLFQSLHKDQEKKDQLPKVLKVVHVNMYML